MCYLENFQATYLDIFQARLPGTFCKLFTLRFFKGSYFETGSRQLHRHFFKDRQA